MTAVLPALDALPRQNATQVKNKWGEVVRQVHARGTVAVTNHSTIEMVMVSADVYQALLDTVEKISRREQTEIDALTDQFRARLASLQQPDAHDRLADVMSSKGKAKSAHIVGETF